MIPFTHNAFLHTIPLVLAIPFNDSRIVSMFFESKERAILRISSTLVLASFARASELRIERETNQLHLFDLLDLTTAHHDSRGIEGSRLLV